MNPNLVKVFCAIIVMIVAGPAIAQQSAARAPRAKGPPVWLDMDQKALDDAYNHDVWAPNAKAVATRRALANQRTLARIGPPQRVAYGPTAVEKLDIYKTGKMSAPILVYIHGGGWRSGSARDSAAFAEMFINAGSNYLALDFVDVQNANGSLMMVADQVLRAVTWVYKNAATFGGNAHRLFIAGHSSGGHLACVVLVTDWRKNFNLPVDTVKGGLCSSGMYDLKPVRLSARRNYIKFDHKTEHALSPQRHIDKINAPVIVSYGTLESPEFQRQARVFAAAVKAAGKPTQIIVGEGFNHYEIAETIGNPYGLLGRAVLEQMGLVGPNRNL